MMLKEDEVAEKSYKNDEEEEMKRTRERKVYGIG